MQVNGSGDFTLPSALEIRNGSCHTCIMDKQITPFPREFYNRDAERVARDLLGTHLSHEVDGVMRVGRVVETEAYLGPHDLAAHSSKGRTPRTEVMFGPPGFAYVYLIYGIYHCLNAVTGAQGHASAVLIRAIHPVANLEGKTQGPGLLCRALGVDRRHNGLDLVNGPVTFSAALRPQSFRVVERPRIGVDYAGEWADKPLRFYVEGDPFVSRK